MKSRSVKYGIVWDHGGVHSYVHAQLDLLYDLLTQLRVDSTIRSVSLYILQDVPCAEHMSVLV